MRPAKKASVYLVVTLLCGSAAMAQGGEQASSASGRLQFVGTLIEKSSAAKQIAQSGSAQAKAKQEEARRIYQQAKEAYEKGDTKRSEELLSDAAKTMFEAVRLAGSSEVTAPKKHVDLDNRIESVNALLAAHERIAREKRKMAAHEDLRRTVNAKLSQARALHDRGDLDGARKAADEAYVAAKVAIEEQRGGDTLVRSLHFSSKEEEYRYELDRNDTHRMLIKVLVEQQGKSQGTQKMVDQFVSKAEQLRKDAERQAAKGDYGGAVRTLESSTKELVRAIRSAGIYIPG